MPLKLSPIEQVDLIFGLGISYEKEGSCRRHFAPSPIKITYNLYQYSKEYKEIYPGAKKQAASKSVKVSEKTIFRFVNSELFQKFGKKVRRNYTSNEYILEPWVIECFENLEKFGFMKFFATDFKKWHRLWNLRILKFAKDKLMNISTWSDLSAKKPKLSTKSEDRCPRGVGIDVPLLGSKISLQGSLEDVIREAKNPFSAKHEEITNALYQEFGMRHGDLHYVTNYLGLRDMQGGVNILRQRVQKGWKVESPIKSFMHCVKEFKNLRKSA